MKTCLVVDDSSVIRKVARRILEGLEFEIAEAEDGEQALEACRGKMPDAILLDWNMPKMDGYEFLRSLRKMPQGDRPKVVFCTTFGSWWSMMPLSSAALLSAGSSRSPGSRSWLLYAAAARRSPRSRTPIPTL